MHGPLLFIQHYSTTIDFENLSKLRTNTALNPGGFNQKGLDEQTNSGGFCPLAKVLLNQTDKE